MTAPAFSPLPLDFHARIPCDDTFVPIVAELTGRLAKVAGFDEARCSDIGREVEEAFTRNLRNSDRSAGSMELALRVTATAFDASVLCGTTPLLDLSWPRPA